MPENFPLFEQIAHGLAYPEGPFWSDPDHCLYFVEWTGNRVCRWQDGRIDTIFTTGKGSGPSGLCQDSAGNFWICLYSACRLVKYSHEGKLLQSFHHAGNDRFKGPNDLVLDTQGGVYFSDSGNFNEDWVSGRPAGCVYYLSPSGNFHLVADGLCYPNGIVLSKDGSRLWVNEHRKNQVLEIPIIGEQMYSQPIRHTPLDSDCLLQPDSSFELGPDGLCLDGQGRLWVAHYGGGKIIGINPTREIRFRLHLPQGRYPTNLTWRPQVNTLYITESDFGALYRLDLNHLTDDRSL
ncbi:MAG: SMP-30/gluconolactonase/LRE family protein [Anaerolineales bacterium]|nr:SMP-30/gluconolactonase/LRE family protein [Anaerolineales bacterium]